MLALVSYSKPLPTSLLFFFFNDTAPTEIYTLPLHDAFPISRPPRRPAARGAALQPSAAARLREPRSEEHTSELQSRLHLVCRLLLEKKKKESSQRSHCKREMPGLSHVNTHHDYRSFTLMDSD